MISTVGTFITMRGGDQYPGLIRKTEPKPLRIFLEDGSADTWNPAFGSWWLANQDMETALAYADYDLAHAWGTHGHDFSVMCAILPEVLLATKEPAEKIGLPEIRLITQAERNSLDEMVNAVCTKVLGPDWKKRGRRR